MNLLSTINSSSGCLQVKKKLQFIGILFSNSLSFSLLLLEPVPFFRRKGNNSYRNVIYWNHIESGQKVHEEKRKKHYSLFFCVMFCRLFFVLLVFFFWPYCCLSFDLRFLITHLVSSNSSFTRSVFDIGFESLREKPKLQGSDENIESSYFVRNLSTKLY